MNKNITSIIFLFFVIFMTLMFGQDIEGFDAIDQTDGTGSSGIVGQGTYFTKENGTGDSIFSTYASLSQAIKTNYATVDNCLTGAQTNAAKALCLTTLISVAPSATTQTKMATLATLATNQPLISLQVLPATHAATQATISAKNATNVTMQQELDRKMSEMLDEKTGMKLESAAKYNAATYTSIMWTVLATTALYYIFVKL